jgi:hypothetical protein
LAARYQGIDIGANHDREPLSRRGGARSYDEDCTATCGDAQCASTNPEAMPRKMAFAKALGALVDALNHDPKHDDILHLVELMRKQHDCVQKLMLKVKPLRAR